MALGLESGYIGDGDLTASSYKPGNEAREARLHGTSYWKPSQDDKHQYFTVNLGVKTNLTAIASQGGETCWITAYTLDTFFQNEWVRYMENNVIKVNRTKGFLFKTQ